MYQYLPSGINSISIVISLFIGYVITQQLKTYISSTVYFIVISTILLSVVVYYTLFPYVTMFYHYLFGITLSNTVPTVSVNPNIQIYGSKPVAVPTSSSPIISNSATTLTPYGGISCLLSINTTNTRPNSQNTVYDFAPLLSIHSVTSSLPIMKLVYMPEGNLLQLLTYPTSSNDEDIPAINDDSATRITLGTPPVKKSFSVFIKLRPGNNGATSVELYTNGLLGKTATIRSNFFTSGGGTVSPVIGYSAEKVYPVVDAEMQSVMVWGNTNGLSLKDIQSLSKQTIYSDKGSRYVDNTSCPHNNQS